MEIILFVAGLVLGGLIGLFTNRYFATQSSKELKAETARLMEETAKLRRLSGIMLNGMEQMGWIKLNRDARGEITGQIHERQIQVTGHADVSVESEVIRAPQD